MEAAGPRLGGVAVETRIDLIGAGIYRLSTLMSQIALPAGFTFNVEF